MHWIDQVMNCCMQGIKHLVFDLGPNLRRVIDLGTYLLNMYYLAISMLSNSNEKKGAKKKDLRTNFPAS